MHNWLKNTKVLALSVYGWILLGLSIALIVVLATQCNGGPQDNSVPTPTPSVSVSVSPSPYPTPIEPPYVTPSYPVQSPSASPTASPTSILIPTASPTPVTMVSGLPICQEKCG